MDGFDPKNIDLFSECTDQELDRVRSLSTGLSVSAGKTLTTQGQYGNECLIVCDGTVSIVLDGDEIATAGPGALIGEIALLMGQSRERTATARAQTDCNILVFSAREFSTLMSDIPSVALRVELAAVHRLAANLDHDNADAD
jgi:CRP/FNR family cyclic AMP-dependent transcriptional regulator